MKVLNANHSQQVSRFHKNLKLSQVSKPATHIISYYNCLHQGEHLSKLQDTNLVDQAELDCVEALEEIGNEQHFEVTFVDIEEISKRGLYQCMVQLSTVPVAVCFGKKGVSGLLVISPFLFQDMERMQILLSRQLLGMLWTILSS